jgi:glyoxylase-like metal-dependent hydrolase (beta-lactamase superfamily II)
MQGENPVVIIRNAAATAKINVTKLRGNVSVLEGSGGNIVVLTCRDGKVLVDAGITASRSQITEALATPSDDPVKHLINTHWHFDHTDGNEWLHSIGAEITAHENTRKHLSVTTRVEDWNFTFPPAPIAALPTKLFATDETLHLNGATLSVPAIVGCRSHIALPSPSSIPSRTVAISSATCSSLARSELSLFLPQKRQRASPPT